MYTLWSPCSPAPAELLVAVFRCYKISTCQVLARQACGQGVGYAVVTATVIAHESLLVADVHGYVVLCDIVKLQDGVCIVIFVGDIDVAGDAFSICRSARRFCNLVTNIKTCIRSITCFSTTLIDIVFCLYKIIVIGIVIEMSIICII